MLGIPSTGRRARFGLAARLGLGFGAIAIVLLAGNWYASRDSGYAIDTLRDTEVARVPLSRAADALTDQMLAYDRTVLDQLRTDDEATRYATAAAEQSLQSVVQTYVAQLPVRPAATDRLLAELRIHVEIGTSLIDAGRKRLRTLAAYRATLSETTRRVSSAFNANAQLASSGGARESFARLELAQGVVRDAFNDYLVSGTTDAVRATERAQRAMRRTLDTHRDELTRSPGRAWIEMMDEDVATGTRLFREITAAEREIAEIRAEFAASSAAISVRLDDAIAAPASVAVADSASAAAEATQAAQQTYRHLSVVVIGLILVVSVLTTITVTAPVRRLIRASRELAAGAWSTRAPRGGPRELDELAGAFNSMAEQLAEANAVVANHQQELEDRVRARTRKLSYIAHHDALTSLPNRRYGFTHLRRIVRGATGAGTDVGMLALDVDNFKTINDHLGHALGDELLRAIAVRLRDAVGEHSFVARLGGDEFIVLIDEAPGLAQLEALAARIVTAFHRPLAVAGRELLISVSVGVSSLPLHAGDAAALARAADAALFQAKAQGRNRVAIFAPELLAGSATRFRTEQALARAIDSGALALVFQPQVTLETGETTLVEALVRWRREDGSLVPASEFIAIAEQSGLIIGLGDWVLETALVAASAWRKAGIAQPRVAINVSPQQLLDCTFIDRAASALVKHGLPPSALEIELTETALQTGATTIEALKRAREIGLQIALDDFGTGYSSLNSLSRLPLRRVKIDRSLIVDLDSNMRSAAIARAIISVCHSLGLEVTVEGVERIDQLRLLMRRGPIEAQGHLLARPLSPEDVPAFIAQSARHFAALLAHPVAESRAADGASVVSLRPAKM